MFLMHLERYSVSAFGFQKKMEVSLLKALSFYFQNLETELKNLVSTKSCKSLKMAYRFSTFEQKMLTSTNLWKPGS